VFQVQNKPGTAWNSLEQPGTSLEQAWNSLEQPGTSLEQAWNKPGTSLEQPGTSLEQAWNKPGTAWNKPGTAWNKPGTAWNKPGTAWNKPGTSLEQPGTVLIKKAGFAFPAFLFMVIWINFYGFGFCLRLLLFSFSQLVIQHVDSAFGVSNFFQVGYYFGSGGFFFHLFFDEPVKE